MRDGAAVPQQSEVLIGLDVGTAGVEAVAFAPDGHELARAAATLPCRQSPHGVVEQEVGETWGVTALVLHHLAQSVPHLQARTVALAITGEADGTWLLDEDGDAVGPAWLPQDGRAAPVVARWRQSGVALRVQEISGRPLGPSARSAQLACLAGHHPEILAAAVTAFAAKDCVYFLCTGERATDAAAAFGDWRTGAYDSRVLELLDLEQIARLLPEIVDGTGNHGALTTAAAAATGLLAGTPVVLAPGNIVTTALALGLDSQNRGVGGTVLGVSNLHMRACADQAIAASLIAKATILPFAPTGSWLGVVPQSGTTNVDWLVRSAEQLLLDAGLIGLPQSELRALLERRAAEDSGGAVSYRPFEGGPNEAAFCRLSVQTTFYDMLRAIYEGLGGAARDGYHALGFRPSQVRVNAGAAGPLAYDCLAASLDAPVLTVGWQSPAAAGAALIAAVSLGQYQDAIDGQRAWVEPRLRDVQPVDRKQPARPVPCAGAAAPACTERA